MKPVSKERELFLTFLELLRGNTGTFATTNLRNKKAGWRTVISSPSGQLLRIAIETQNSPSMTSRAARVPSEPHKPNGLFDPGLFRLAAFPPK